MPDTTGGSSHNTQPTTDNEPGTFKIQILPAGSAPKEHTFQPDVNGERAPGQPNNTADTIFDKATEGSKADVQKGLGSSTEDDKSGEEAAAEPQVEIKSATEMEPEVAGSY